MAFIRLAFALLSLAAAATAAAQDYPSQPIRLIVPGPPGVGIDLDARPIAQKMAELLRQPMVIEEYTGWDTARARLEQVNSAGYRAMAVEMPGVVRVIIQAGKHTDLTRLPGRTIES